MIQEQTEGLYLTSPTGERFTNPFFLFATCFAIKPSPVSYELPIEGGRSAEVWISPDPLRQYSSPYTYCGNNPISCIDPDGMAGVHASGSGGITWNGERYGGAYTLSFNHNSGKSIFNPSSYSVGLLKTVNLDGGIPSSNGAGTAWGLSVGLSNSDAASQVTGGGRTTGFSSMGASFLGKWLSGGLGFDMSDSYSDNNFSIPTENAKGAPVRMLDLSLRLPGKTFGAETHDQVKTDTKLIWQLGGDN